MSKKAPLYVTSPSPLDDGGRKYNVIIAAAAAAGAAAGLLSGAMNGLIICALVGAFLGYLTKATIINVKWYGLREITFALGHEVEKDVLFQRLIERLTPMGMMVEMNTDGTPVITYQALIYEISLNNEDQTFTIWWRKSLARAFFSINILVVIPNYRKAVAAMGILAYHIQQISMEQAPASTEAMSHIKAAEQRKCPKCGAAVQNGTKFCGSCGAQLLTAEPAKNNFSMKIIGIAAVIILGMGAVILSRSGEETSQTSAYIANETEREAEDAQMEETNQKVDVTAYDLYAAFQENDAFTYTLNDKMTAFLQTHEELFPAASRELLLSEGVVEEALEARQILKNPDRYGDRLMFLPELQVIQIFESEVDTDQYVTEINAVDMMGQSYYIIYNGVLDTVFENDWIDAYALPLGAATSENIEGGEVWLIPMAGCYVEKLNEETTRTAAVPITEGEYTNYDSGVWLYVYYYSDDGTLRAQFNIPGEAGTFFEVCEIEAYGDTHRFADENGGTYVFTAADGGLTIYAESESTLVDGYYVMTQDYSNAG